MFTSNMNKHNDETGDSLPTLALKSIKVLFALLFEIATGIHAYTLFWSATCQLSRSVSSECTTADRSSYHGIGAN